MRKSICALFALMLMLFPFAASAEDNMLFNGDFSMVSDGLPEGWRCDMWITDAGASVLSVEEDGYDGPCVSVRNSVANDARFAQAIIVEPDTLYRISCMAKAEGFGQEGYGANISILDTFCYSPVLSDTDGEWQRLELYGRTGPEQTVMTVLARAGGYSQVSVGQAWFDSFEMVMLETAPEGVPVEDFSPMINSNAAAVEVEAASDEPAEPARNTEAFVLFTCVCLLAVLGVARKAPRSPLRPDPVYAGGFAILMTCALVLRLILAVAIPGYRTDINCFSAWSDLMAKEGPAGFYSSGVWCDYPPLYMWMLGPIGALRSALGLEYKSDLFVLLIKLWPILFDMACVWLIWRRAKNSLGARTALLLCAFFAFNPAVLTDSAAWGQIDSILTLLVVLCALDASEERYTTSLIWFALAALIKPQALLFAPLGLFAILCNLVRSRENIAARLLRLLAGLAAALGTIYLCAFISAYDPAQTLAYNLLHPVTWIIELYSGTMSGYSYVNVNTLNLYCLLDLNWAKTADYPLATVVAWVLFALSYAYCAVLCALSKDRRHLLLLGGVLIMLICTFGPMIHERYVYPALLLLIMSYIHCRDKRVLIGAALLSATLFMNEFLVLQGGMTEANFGHLQASENWLNYPLSALNVFNAFFMAWTALDISVRGRTYPLESCRVETEPRGRHTLLGSGDHKLRLRRVDVLLMAGVTLLYSLVAFVNLGSTEAPQTTWVSGAGNESVTFDLGETKRFRMTYYGNICDTNFTVELSNDGVSWSESCHGKYRQGEIFRWLWFVPSDSANETIYKTTVPTDDGSAYLAYSGYEGEQYPYQTARYVRLSAVAAGLKLSEVGFLGEDGSVLPIVSVEQEGDRIISSAELLIDEQHTIPDHPSYYNSTYFDEIYHARTAYEHLHGLSTYEWTHPPLGKVLMMLGIELFGMTPFGWRFMGTLVGVLMLPLMYLLVKQLTKSTKLSFIAMFLLAVDSMHFTQTRIATIDSYAVFWIMLMYFFMFRYMQMRWTSRGAFLRSLIPLGLCGLTMGIAWATKWIGLYASVGLALLFFWSLYRRYREYRYAKSEVAAGDRSELLKDVSASFRRRALITIAFCLVFFVLIPTLIYYSSYFWHLRGKGQTLNVNSFFDIFSADCFREVFVLQERILNYHAGLGGDTHYFRSDWYEWPIIWWPMWFYGGNAFMPEGVISSISCMGNPAVWWFGLVALLFVLFRMCVMRRAPKNYVILIISFASQYLPWVLVPRSTFIYHYFASVPFIIIASVFFLKWIRERSPAAFKAVSITLMVAALLLFILFYPLESGLPVARSFANCLRWFKWYNF